MNLEATHINDPDGNYIFEVLVSYTSTVSGSIAFQLFGFEKEKLRRNGVGDSKLFFAPASAQVLPGVTTVSFLNRIQMNWNSHLAMLSDTVTISSLMQTGTTSSA